MPFIRFKGFDRHLLESVSPLIAEQFAAIVNIPKERVKLELLSVIPITDNPKTIEIFIFPRHQEVHNQIATMLNQFFLSYGYDNIHIFFVLLSPSLYYKEGLPLTDYKLESGEKINSITYS